MIDHMQLFWQGIGVFAIILFFWGAFLAFSAWVVVSVVSFVIRKFRSPR